MPHYRFHVHDGIIYEDRAGALLPDDTAAVAEGAQIVREIKRDSGDGCEEWWVEVRRGSRTIERIEFRCVE